MHLVVRTEKGDHEIALKFNPSTAHVSDLTEALGGASGSAGITIDHAFVGCELRLVDSGLFEGAVIMLAAHGTTGFDDDRIRSTELCVVGGLEAGRCFRLGPGDTVVGRETHCDVVIADGSVSRRHCQLGVSGGGTATVQDLGSRNGTFVDGRRADGVTTIGADSFLQVGDIPLRLRSSAEDDRLPGADPRRATGPDGTMPFGRPPRSAPPRPLPPLSVPSAPQSSAKAPFSMASLVAPLIFGAVMVVALGNALYGLFAVLSPVMLVGNWYESRFRAKHSLRREMREYTAALTKLGSNLNEQRQAEVDRQRRATPDLAEIRRRVRLPSVRLWERRLEDPDFLLLSAGFGNLPWRPILNPERDDHSPEVAQLLARYTTLPLVPVVVELSAGGVVGLVGERDSALALARGLLCQAVTHHGPADLSVAVATSTERAVSWDWTKWLPHVRDPNGASDDCLLAAGHDESSALLAELVRRKQRGEGARMTLAVLDDESLTQGRDAPGRLLLQRIPGEKQATTTGIVIATSEGRLPAACTTVIKLSGQNGAANLRRPQSGETIDTFAPAGVSETVARDQARSLARFEDPELQTSGGGLPDAVALPELLNLAKVDGPAIAHLWDQNRVDPGACAAVGVSEAGPFAIDLVRNGPHGLIGGTTGSGKSELLRTLVLALATQVSPDHLSFVLLDFKGGATFDELDRLPHTVGVATDLDEHLAERALRCLQAELRSREQRLREAEVGSLEDYLDRRARPANRSAALEPLPRLVVIIDEFAEMASALPDFLKSLVGIARRGRSLGVHMILATQKPGGSVKDDIRANTDLKIALRVQDDGDSVDVIGVADAARINRAQRGRAYIKLGHEDIVSVQTAYASGVSSDGSGPPIETTPFLFGRHPYQPASTPSVDRRSEAATDATRLLDAISEAFRLSGRPSPRRAWTDELPPIVPLEELQRADGAEPPAIPMALADDPEAQAQYPWGWNLSEGNLLLYGIGGSGTTTALAVIALSLARTHSPDDLHLYVMDFGAGELAGLAVLPHTGAVVGPAERERQLRLIRRLSTELERRRSMDAQSRRSEPTIVVLLDNYGAFRGDFSEMALVDAREALERVYADGPNVNMHMAMSADRAGAYPGALANLTKQKLLFRLADPHEFGGFGVPARLVPKGDRFLPGRAFVADTQREIQLAWPGDDVRQAALAEAQRAPRPSRPAPAIGVLPDAVHLDDVATAAQLVSSPWYLPIGIGDDDLSIAGFAMHEGDHALIAGPPRAGKSTVLVGIAHTLRSAAPNLSILAIALRPSPLRDSKDVDSLATTPSDATELLASCSHDEQAHAILIDDADAFEDPDGAAAALLLSQRRDVHMWAAARPDSIPRYGHWTERLRRAKLGLLLQPSPDRDGDLLGARLPRHQHVPMRAGRGYLVADGAIELIQAARLG